MAYYRSHDFAEDGDLYDDFMMGDDYDDDSGDELMIPVSHITTTNKDCGLGKSGGDQTDATKTSWKQPRNITETKRSTDSIVWQNHKSKSANPSQNGKTGRPTFQPKQPPLLAVDDLRMAAMQNKVEVVKQCLDHGIPVDSVYTSGWTPLMYATNSANVESVKALLEAGADPNFHKDLYSVLMSACSKAGGNEQRILQCIELLLDKGADVNAFDRYHMSPLIYAAKNGYMSCVKKLAENKADLNKQDSRGYTGLIYAVIGSHIKVVLAFIELGADVNKQTSDGSRAADFAVMNNNTQIHQMLKRHGDVSEKKLVLTEADLNEAEANQKLNQERKTAVTYGDLQLFLSGLELGHMIPLFEDHQVTFEGFLKMSDKDLQDVGVNQFSVRKKILDSIRQTHKKEWENSSLPGVQYNKKISCAEAIAMVQNIKKHLNYIATTIGFVSDQIKGDKQILATAQEGVGAEQLCLNSDEAMTNLRLLYSELSSLREHLAEVKDEPGYRPPDLVLPSNSSQSNRRHKHKPGWIRRTFQSKVTIGVGIGVAILWWKRELVTDTVNAIAGKLQDYMAEETV